MKTSTFQQNVEAVLTTIAATTGLGAVYHGFHDRTTLMRGSVREFCRFCLEHDATTARCRHACRQAAQQALASGEPHYQRCWAGLLFITVAVAPRDAICGGVSVGGFYCAGEEGDVADAVRSQVDGLRTSEQRHFIARLKSLRETTPAAMRGLGRFMLETTFSSGLNSAEFFRQRNARYLQQREIAEAFTNVRREGTPLDIPEDTYQLVAFLHKCDPERAMHFVSQYLAKLLLVSNWDLDKLKAHIRVLLAMMTSREIQAGAGWAVASAREARRLHRIEKCTVVEDCCYEIADVVLKHFGDGEQGRENAGTITERSLRWMQEHLAEPVTISSLARAVHAGESTLTHYLRRDTGRSVHQWLTQMRIDEARRLLAATTLKISEVAQACGFCDQSHLTRAFTAAVNLSPGQFRKLLNFTKDDI